MTRCQPKKAEDMNRSVHWRTRTAAAVVVALSLGSAHFLSWRNLLNTVEAGSIYGIVAIGCAIAFTILISKAELKIPNTGLIQPHMQSPHRIQPVEEIA